MSGLFFPAVNEHLYLLCSKDISKLFKEAAKFSLRKKFSSSLLQQNFLLRENSAATVYNSSGAKVPNVGYGLQFVDLAVIMSFCCVSEPKSA